MAVEMTGCVLWRGRDQSSTINMACFQLQQQRVTLCCCFVGPPFFTSPSTKHYFAANIHNTVLLQQTISLYYHQ
jgi:hypothetical protein